MKPLKAIWIFLFLLSCQLRNEPVLEGDRVNMEDKREIDKMIAQIHKGLQKKDGGYINNILSDELKTALVNYTEKIQELVNEVHLDSQNFLRNTVFECQINNNIFSKIGTVESKENHFSFVFPIRRHVYVKLFTLSSATEYEKYLVSTIFIKEKQRWKLGGFYIGYYSYYGRNAHDLYSEASIHYYNDNYVLAYLYSQMMLATINPANTNLRYNLEDEMKQLGQDALEKLKSVSGLPAIVETVPTKPEIFEVRVQLSHRIPSPIVYYKTSVSLANYKALEDENKQIHKIIENYLPNAKAIFDSVCYVAVNEFPNNYKAVDQISFSQLAEVGK